MLAWSPQLLQEGEKVARVFELRNAAMADSGSDKNW